MNPVNPYCRGPGHVRRRRPRRARRPRSDPPRPDQARKVPGALGRGTSGAGSAGRETWVLNLGPLELRSGSRVLSSRPGGGGSPSWARTDSCLAPPRPPVPLNDSPASRNPLKFGAGIGSRHYRGPRSRLRFPSGRRPLRRGWGSGWGGRGRAWGLDGPGPDLVCSDFTFLYVSSGARLGREGSCLPAPVNGLSGATTGGGSLGETGR